LSAIDNTPINKNFLSPLNFKFQIKKAPHVNFFIQRATIPEIVLPDTPTLNPLVKIPQHGEHIQYGPLHIEFKVDEDLKNYLEIHNWIKALGTPENLNPYREIQSQPAYTGDGIHSDISLILLSSTKMPNYEITFVDAFPVSLGQLDFRTTDTNVNYIQTYALFKYTHYNIINI
jgi:hypothetical protein